MQTIGLLALGLCLCAAPGAAAAEEEANPFTGAAAVGVYSDYMLRGVNLYDGVSIQPSLTLNYDTGYGIVSAATWFHLSAEGDRQAEKFTENDNTLSYTLSFAPFTLRVGHIWYVYPNSPDTFPDTGEWFQVVVLDDSQWNPFPLTPTVTAYQDYRAFDLQYYELGLSHTFEAPPLLGEGSNLTPFVTFGFASNAEKVYDSNGLVHVTYGVSTSLTVGELTLVPTFNYTSKVDDNTVNEFWFGTSVTYAF